MAQTLQVGTVSRPTRYVIAYTDRRLWEALHRVRGEPADPTAFRYYLDVRTLRDARSEAKRLLGEWKFAQPCIKRRVHTIKVGPDSWDYWLEVEEYLP